MGAWLIWFCCTVFLIGELDGQVIDKVEHLIFRLYTREQPHKYQELKFENISSIWLTSFNPNRPTRIFVHGFWSVADVIHLYRDAYLKLGNYNFIGVDWTKGASTFNYFKAKQYMELVSFNPTKL